MHLWTAFGRGFDSPRLHYRLSLLRVRMCLGGAIPVFAHHERTAPIMLRKGLVQHRINAASPGAYVPGSAAAYSAAPPSIVSFEEVLGYRPSNEPCAEWHSPLEAAVIESVNVSPHGATELSLVFAQAVAPIIEEVEAVERPTDRPWFCDGLASATHRTSAGAPERVWRAPSHNM